MKLPLKNTNFWLAGGLLLTFGGVQAQTAPPASVTEPVTTEPATQATLTEQHSLFSPEAYTIDSAIEDRLNLTDEQRQQLKAAYDEVMAPVLARQSSVGTDSRFTAKEQRAFDKHRAAELASANRELRRRYSAILTPEQNAIVRQADAVTKSVVKEVGAVYAARLKAADPAQRTALEAERAAMIQSVVQSRLDHRDKGYDPNQSLLVAPQAMQK